MCLFLLNSNCFVQEELELLCVGGIADRLALTLTFPFSFCCHFICQLPGNPDGPTAQGDPSQEGGWVPGNPDGFKARRIPAKRGPKRVRYSFVLAASILAFFDFFFSLRALFFAAFFLANSSLWWGSMRV